MCTKTITYFEETASRMKVGLNTKEALTFSSQTAELLTQLVCRQSSFL